MNKLSIKEIQAKSIITKSKLPQSDYVINPYGGCMHACKYCYACFMRRFTNHTEPWGQFVDVKINAVALMPKNIKKFENKSITIGSVTDPYQPVERKYQLTREMLKKLLYFDAKIYLITKSDLIVRDIDLLQQLRDCTVLISLAFTDNSIMHKIEPRTCLIAQRIKTLKLLRQSGIKTVLFISPIFPDLTDWETLITMTKDYVAEYWFENLNLYPSIQQNIYRFLNDINSSLIPKYHEIYFINNSYWSFEKEKIINLCQRNGLKYKICFHH